VLFDLGQKVLVLVSFLLSSSSFLRFGLLLLLFLDPVFRMNKEFVKENNYTQKGKKTSLSEIYSWIQLQP